MKSVFLFRDCYDARYILSRLEQKKLVQTVILETGKEAKLRKLKRIFRKAPIYQYPIRIMDVIFLFIYSLWIEGKVIKRLGQYDYPKDKVKLIVNDANEDKCIQFIQKNNPSIVFIYGTAILSKNFIKKVNTKILNIHAGILPFYRNVHSDFWAYSKKDYKNIGVSLFYLDAGIDTGDIAIQKRIKCTGKDSLSDIKAKNLNLSVSLIESSFKKIRSRTLKKIRQDISNTGFYPTPTFKDILRLFLQSF